jgi:hypothetical protein
MNYKKEFKLLESVTYLDNASAWIIPKQVIKLCSK